MSDKFTPLTLGSLPPRDPAFTAAAPAATPPPASSPFRTLTSKSAEAPAVPCAKPTVTLERNAGGIVTAIRVQCGCGSVTDLSCSY